MSEAVSARPELLSSFAADETARGSELAETIAHLSTNFNTFVALPGGYAAAGGTTMVNAQAPAVAQEHSELSTFVQLVHDSLLAADHSDANGLVTADHNAVVNQMIGLAAERGIDINALAAVDPPITVERPEVGTIPQDSGYVNDPIATATGNLVIPAYDFAMPPRLRVLSFERYYSSGAIESGAFGPGWWSWTNVTATPTDAGWITFVTPDGAVIDAQPTAEGDWAAPPDQDLRFSQPASGELILRWGPRSRHPFETWTFDDSSQLVRVEGCSIGVSEFEYRSGRLRSIRHDSGRSLTLNWLAREEGWTRDQVIEYENDPGHYQIEDRGSNSSHRFEEPR